MPPFRFTLVVPLSLARFDVYNVHGTALESLAMNHFASKDVCPARLGRKEGREGGELGCNFRILANMGVTALFSLVSSQSSLLLTGG